MGIGVEDTSTCVLYLQKGTETHDNFTLGTLANNERLVLFLTCLSISN